MNVHKSSSLCEIQQKLLGSKQQLVVRQQIKDVFVFFCITCKLMTTSEENCQSLILKLEQFSSSSHFTISLASQQLFKEKDFSKDITTWHLLYTFEDKRIIFFIFICSECDSCMPVTEFLGWHGYLSVWSVGVSSALSTDVMKRVFKHRVCMWHLFKLVYWWNKQIMNTVEFF